MKTAKLTDAMIQETRPLAKQRKVTDGAGLYLEITPTGGKLWRYAYRFGGKQKLLALGKYPDVSLQEARRRHAEARTRLAQGIDPSMVRKLERQLVARRNDSAHDGLGSSPRRGAESFAIRKICGKNKEVAGNRARADEGTVAMAEMVLDKHSLQETLFRMIPTERVRLHESNGVISLTPVREGSGLLGIGVGSRLTTEKLAEYSREEKELENRTFGR